MNLTLLWNKGVRPALSVCFLAASLAALGCSRAAMDSNPIWDPEGRTTIGDAENRINLWPVLYHRDPLLSVMWPLFASTEKGHALVPLYDFQKEVEGKSDLRIISIHQWIPALARFKADGYWRLLNVMHDPGETTLSVLPLYFQHPGGEILLLPVFYREKGFFWTPIYTHSKDLKGILGPLFNIEKNSGVTQYNFPFPLLAYWHGDQQRGVRAFPLLYMDRDSGESHVNVGAYAFDLQGTSSERSLFYLWFLGGATRRGDSSFNYLIPFWWGRTDAKSSQFVSLPYTHANLGGVTLTNALLNGYLRLKTGSTDYQSFIFPLFHQLSNDDGNGHGVAPLYYTFLSNEGVRSFYSPLASFRSDGSLLNIGGPLYTETNKDGERRAFAFWPLISWWSRGGEKGAWLIPAFYLQWGNTGEREFISPLGAFVRNGDESLSNFLGPLYYSHATGTKGYRTIAWPLVHSWRDGKEKNLAVAPLFWLSRGGADSHFISPLYSQGQGTESSFRNVGLFLFNRSATREETSTRLLWPFFRYQKLVKDNGRRFTFFPFFSRYNSDREFSASGLLLNGSHRHDEAEVRREMQAEIEKYADKEKSTSRSRPRRDIYNWTALLGLVNFHKWLEAAPPTDEKSKEIDSPNAEIKTPAIIAHKKGRLFPFYSYSREEDRGGKFNFLWRLYQSSDRPGENGETYRRKRVLWQLFNRETEGKRLTLDIFPFIAYDRSPDLVKWNFAGGLAGYSRKEQTKTVRLLYFPIGLD